MVGYAMDKAKCHEQRLSQKWSHTLVLIEGYERIIVRYIVGRKSMRYRSVNKKSLFHQ